MENLPIREQQVLLLPSLTHEMLSTANTVTWTAAVGTNGGRRSQIETSAEDCQDVLAAFKISFLHL